MNEKLDQYLAQAYRRDILGESGVVEMPAPDPQLLASVKAEIARIDALRLGAHLVNRDFVSYQNRRALVKLLAQLEAQKPQEGAEDAP
jgi:hypothetical protein